MQSIRRIGDSKEASTLRGRALLALREMLLRGSYAPGKRLEEIELSRNLGVSRPVLRSVLEHLCSEGLLTVSPAGEYAVRHFTLDDIRDVILARSALEGQAASLAAKRIQDPSELDAARKLNAEMEEAIASSAPEAPTVEEMSRFGDLNAAFHGAVVALARSPMLSWCLQRVQSAAFASPAAVVLPAEGDGARRAFQEHERILEAIQAGDAARADALVRQHAHLALDALTSAIDGRPHLSRNIALELVRNKPPKLAGRRIAPRAEGKGTATGSTSERMLDAAAQLFREKGFHAATTRELANRLNVQQASLYHHFRKKEDLLHRIYSQTMDDFLADLAATQNRTENGPDRVGAFIDAHLRTMFRYPERALVMATEFKALSRPHFAEVSAKITEYSQILESELNAALKQGTLRTDIPTKLIRLSLLNVLSWTPRWFRPNGALSAAELASVYERIFWEGVTNPASGEARPVRLRSPSLQRPRRRNGQLGTLERVIRGAAELFARQGYECTSTRNLASLLGIEKATLYYHVEGKEDLLYAICKASIEQLTRDVNAAVGGIEDPLEQLQVWIHAHLTSLLRHQTQHATALAEARALSGDRLAEIVGMRKAYQRRIRSLIEAGQKDGRLRTDMAAKYLGLMLEGLLDRTVVWYQKSDALSPGELADSFGKLFITGATFRA